MAYSADYSASDLSAVIIDIIVGIGVALVGFVSIVGLILLYRWLKGKKLM